MICIFLITLMSSIFSCAYGSLVFLIGIFYVLCFAVGLFIFVVMICRSNLYIMTINPSFPICIANIFSQTVTSILTLLIVSFVIQEFLIFNKSASLLLYGFWVAILRRKSFLNSNYENILLYFPLNLYCFIFYV